MKVFNLTDIGTPQLVNNKLVNHTLAVGSSLIGPGESADVPDASVGLLRAGIQVLVGLGALSVKELPPAYVTAKANQKRIETGASALETKRPAKPKEG